jgi:hypothetical protein
MNDRPETRNVRASNARAYPLTQLPRPAHLLWFSTIPCGDLSKDKFGARTMALIQSSADGAFVLARWQFRWQEYALVARKDGLVAPPFEGRLEGGDLDRPTASGRDGHDHEAH